MRMRQVAHLSNVCDVDCSIRALLLDGADQPVHCAHNVMVVVPAGRGNHVAPPSFAPENMQCAGDATLGLLDFLGREGGRGAFQEGH